MKNKNLLASVLAAILSLTVLQAQSLKPGTVTFQNINGNVTSQNINTGVVEEINEETLLTEGFIINTDENGYLDIIFSNGVVGRIAPNSHVEISSFIVSSGNSQRTYTQNEKKPVLILNLECGDIVVNATEKDFGNVFVNTPTTEVKSDIAKFFVSHGATTNESQSVTRAINLGVEMIDVNSKLENDFVVSNNQVSYGYFVDGAELKTQTLYPDASAVVLSKNESEQMKQTAAQPATSYNTTTQTNTTQHHEVGFCDRATYTLIPYDRCFHERLSALADYVLLGGINPMGQVIVTAADADSTYFNVQSGEVGSLTAGMTLPEGTIIRSAFTGEVSVVFPNGATMDIIPGSNVYLDFISTQPVLSNAKIENQTNIGVRVETGKIVTNTLNSPQTDTFAVISPLDNHHIPPNTIVSVEFLQMDSNAFQTVSHNETPEGATGINTTVLTAQDLSFVSDNITFIEYAADGVDLNFITPPAYTHITESAIIPPTYDFIDRTIAFAAGATPGPTPIGTPGNPGNNIQTGDGVDPVTP